MADYLTQMSQAIAAARPKAPTSFPSRRGGFQVGTHKEGYGKAFEGIGKAAGAPLGMMAGRWLRRRLDTETMTKEAEQAREIVAGMADEVKQTLTMREDVQRRRNELVKHAPHLFVDASEVWEDESFKGKWEYAPAIPTEEERVKRKEAGVPVKKTQLYREREAKIGFGEAQRKIYERTARVSAALEANDIELARTELEALKEDLRIKKEEAPLKKESLEVQVARVREDITSLKSKRRLAEELQPHEIDFLKARTTQATKLGESYDKDVENAVDKARMEEQRKDLNVTYKTHFDTVKQVRKKYELIGTLRPHEYATEILTHTQTLSNALGTTDFNVQEEGGQLVNVSLPTPLMSAQGALAVNQALNESYTAFMSQYKKGGADPEVLQGLYEQAEKLHDSTFGFINKETLKYIPPAIQMPAEDIRWKMLEMQYVSVFELGTPPEDPQEAEAWEADKISMGEILGRAPAREPSGFLYILFRPWTWLD
jgi:hypothetical protein